MKLHQILIEDPNDDKKENSRRNFLKGKVKTNTLPKMDIPDATSIGQVVPYKSQTPTTSTQEPTDDANNQNKQEKDDKGQPKSHSRRSFFKRVGGTIANAMMKTSLPGRAVKALMKQGNPLISPFGEMPTKPEWENFPYENWPQLKVKWFTVFSSNFAKTGEKAIVAALNPAHAADLVQNWEVPFPRDGGTIAKVVNSEQEDPDFIADKNLNIDLAELIFGDESPEMPDEECGVGVAFDKELTLQNFTDLKNNLHDEFERYTDYIETVKPGFDPIHSFRKEYDAEMEAGQQREEDIRAYKVPDEVLDPKNAKAREEFFKERGITPGGSNEWNYEEIKKAHGDWVRKFNPYWKGIP